MKLQNPILLSPTFPYLKLIKNLSNVSVAYTFCGERHWDYTLTTSQLVEIILRILTYVFSQEMYEPFFTWRYEKKTIELQPRPAEYTREGVDGGNV